MQSDSSAYHNANRALNDSLLSGRFRGRPVYLTLGRDGREAVAASLGVPPDDVDDNIARAVSAMMDRAGDPYDRLAKSAQAWRHIGKGSPPTFTALLYVLCLAAERMHEDDEFSAINYYQRLHQLTGVDKDRLSLHGKATLPFWLLLNQWLRETNYEYGRPTSRQLHSWKYVSYAISQVIVRIADRALFYSLFEDFGFSANDQMSEEEIEPYLDDWIPKTGSNARLRSVWKRRELRPRVCQAALEALQDWSLVTGRHQPETGGSIARHLSLAASIIPFPKRRLSISIGTKGEIPEAVERLRLVGAGSRQFALGNRFYGGFATLYPDADLDLASILTSGIELAQQGGSGARYEWRPRLVVPLAQSESGAYWLEVVRTSLARRYILLCRDRPTLRLQVDQLLAGASVPGYTVATSNELPGVPAGWVLYQGVSFFRIPEDVPRELEVLAPLPSYGVLHADGGLALGNGTWHSSSRPTLHFLSDRGPTTIEVLEEDNDGEFRRVREASSAEPDCHCSLVDTVRNEEASYFAVARRGDDRVAELSLLLRSAANPRPLDRQRRDLLSWRALASAAPATEAPGISVTGHRVDGLPATLPEVETAQTRLPSHLTGEREDDDAPVAGVAGPVHPGKATCVMRGYHFWRCEPFEKGESRSKPKRMECMSCHVAVLTKDRGKAKAKKQVPPPVRPALVLQKESVSKHAGACNPRKRGHHASLKNSTHRMAGGNPARILKPLEGTVSNSQGGRISTRRFQAKASLDPTKWSNCLRPVMRVPPFTPTTPRPSSSGRPWAANPSGFSGAPSSHAVANYQPRAAALSPTKVFPRALPPISCMSSTKETALDDLCNTLRRHGVRA